MPCITGRMGRHRGPTYGTRSVDLDGVDVSATARSRSGCASDPRRPETTETSTRPRTVGESNERGRRRSGSPGSIRSLAS